MSELRLGLGAVSTIIVAWLLLDASGAPEALTFVTVVFVAFPIGLWLGAQWDQRVERWLRDR